MLINFVDVSNVVAEISTYLKVAPPKLDYLLVDFSIRNAGEENIFFFNFKIPVSTLKSYSNGGRIWIEFPTVDKQGNTIFSPDLGGYKSTGDPVACYFPNKTTETS